MINTEKGDALSPDCTISVESLCQLFDEIEEDCKEVNHAVGVRMYFSVVLSLICRMYIVGEYLRLLTAIRQCAKNIGIDAHDPQVVAARAHVIGERMRKRVLS